MVTAVLAIAGLPVLESVNGRHVGQMVVGGAIGLSVTAAVFANALLWLPAMVVAAAFAIVLSSFLSVFLARHGRIDEKTAFFAMMPGGMAEMANIGAAVGANSEPIALSHALRVGLIVLALPPVIISLDIHGSLGYDRNLTDLDPLMTAVVLAVAYAGIRVVSLTRFNNPWMVGALLGVGTISALGLVDGQMPRPLFALGQFLIGVAVGARFRREAIARLPRVAVVSAIMVVVIGVLLFGFGVLLAVATGLDVASAALAVSPGGMVEMAVTAKALHLSVTLVTAFHIVRALIVNSMAGHFWNLASKTRFLASARWLDRMLFGRGGP